MLSVGDYCYESFVDALNATHRYLEDIGAKMAPYKSFNFASSDSVRVMLSQHVWTSFDKIITVVKFFRYLGASISAAVRLDRSIVGARFSKAVVMARILSKLPIGSDDKCKAIITNILPVALNGVEVSQPPDKSIRSLSSAILDNFTGRRNKRDMYAIYSVWGVNGKDVDPVVQIALRERYL